LLRIRLTRVGKKKQPAYRIVVADSRAPRDGAFIKIIGHYNPLTNPATLTVKEEEAVHWLQKGAKPSDTAAKLLTRLGLMEKAGLEPVIYKGPDVPPGKRPKKGQEEAPARPVAAAAAPAPAATAEAEAPAAEAEATAAPEAEAPVAEAETAAEAEVPAEAPAEPEAPTEEPGEESATEPEASAEEAKDES
jgi:small subunit ribosomal protein S16